MKLSEISNKLKENNIEVTKMSVNASYVLRLSNKSTLIINYSNDEFRKIQVQGNDDKIRQTKKILGV